MSEPIEAQKCGDCVHHPRCVMLFQCPADNETCDWDPSRFRAREQKGNSQ